MDVEDWTRGVAVVRCFWKKYNPEYRDGDGKTFLRSLYKRGKSFVTFRERFVERRNVLKRNSRMRIIRELLFRVTRAAVNPCFQTIYTYILTASTSNSSFCTVL